MGKIDRRIVTVNAYGVYKNITFPLIFKIFKPKGNDTYQTKIELASSIVTELIKFGFKIELVLARKAMLCALKEKDVLVIERLRDAPRSGKPTEFTTEQVLQLFALACELLYLPTV